MNKGHINTIHVRSLLPIDFDADVIPVENVCDRGIFERFALHDVAPVTRGIAYRKKDWHLLGSGLLECFLTPGIPIDRVVRMLEQIRRFLMNQPIRFVL